MIINQDVKRWRQERKGLKKLLQKFDQSIPCKCDEGSTRFAMINALLLVGGSWPVSPDLIKAALELTAYNDRVAKILVENVVNQDYKDLIRNGRKAVARRNSE